MALRPISRDSARYKAAQSAVDRTTSKIQNLINKVRELEQDLARQKAWLAALNARVVDVPGNGSEG